MTQLQGSDFAIVSVCLQVPLSHTELNCSSEVQYYISEKLKEALDAHGVDIKDVLNVLIDVHQNSQIELDGAAAQPPINTIEQFAHFVYERQAHAQHISLYRAYDERHELETALAEETVSI